jgi:hypothetical protein
MQRDNKFKNLQERLEGMRRKVTVALFVDADSVLTERLQDGAADDEILSKILLDVASSLGRVVTTCVYFEENRLQPPVNMGAWSTLGYTLRATPKDATTEDGINLPLLFDAFDSGKQETFDLYVLAVGSTNYNALAQRLVAQGASVVLLCNYSREQRTLPRDSCVYVPLRTVVTKPAAMRAEKKREPSAPNVDDFDFARLVTLLAESESRMPFVAAKYFVTRVMWRLKELKTHEEKQAVFQGAAERGIIEFYEQDNIKEDMNKVSAVKLNRDNEFVQSVLQPHVELEEEGGRSLVITIDGASDNTVTFPASSEEHRTL